jgi:hypothetical protein
VQRYPVMGWHGSSSLAQKIGAADAPGGGAASAAVCEVVAGLALACPAQSAAVLAWLATLVVVLGRPTLATEIPAPAKAGAAVDTLRHREESRGTTVHRQQERHGPAWCVQDPLGVAPAAAKKMVNKSAPEKPLAVELGPIAATGRRARAGGLMGVTLEPTPPGMVPFAWNKPPRCHNLSLHQTSSGNPQGTPCEACSRGGDPWLLRVWPVW